MSAPHCLLASFNDRHVGVECRTEWLAAELRRRVMHLVAPPGPPPSVILHLTLDELETSWIEIRDSTGRCERGSFDYVAYHARKWMTAAFVAAHPELIWLHAAAASMNGAAILLAGPAGAGKSTLLVHLVGRGCDLLADDVVALRPTAGEALPLPFSPEVRAIPRAREEAWPVFLAQTKALAAIAPTQVASTPALVAAIVFLEYSHGVTRPRVARLTTVTAAQALATQALGARNGPAKIGELFDLARRIPCYRLQYSGAAAAAGDFAARLLDRGCR